MIEGLLGRKIGMIQLFDSEGRLRSATVIEADQDINAPYFTGVWSTDPVHSAEQGFISRPVDPHTNPAAIKNTGPIAWLTSDPRGVYDPWPSSAPTPSTCSTWT